MKQTLYSHNLKAYEAVKEHYAEGHRKACVVHATGTGKSYITVALAKDFERVLLVVPNDYVLDQVRKNAGRNMQYTTYAKLMSDARKGMTPTGRYDLIVLDEYHRAGAEQWKVGVQSLLQANGQAYIFGTTATDIRYLDERRNMSDELFEGHVVSTLTIGEAWARNILPSPVYVCSLEDFKETEQVYRERIVASVSDEHERRTLSEQLLAVRKDWENVGGVSVIIRKHLSAEVRRIVVFCPDINSIARYRKLVHEWFAKAGVTINRIYVVESSRKPSTNKKEMDEFQKEDGDGVKIMISVNMLNEGIHVNGVDGIIMLRGTSSGNIYLQQLGRCMHACTDGHRPVVLDLANNISSAFSVSSANFSREDYDKATKELMEEPDEKKPGDFIEVVDYLMDIREVLAKLDERMAYCDRWAVWDRNYKWAKNHFEQTGHFPTKKENANVRHWAAAFIRKEGNKYPDKVEMIYRIGYPMKKDLWMDRYQIAKDFYDKYGKFPHGKEWEGLRIYFSNNARKCPSKERSALLMAIGWRSEESIWETRYKEAKDFYEKHGRFPTIKDNRILREYIEKWKGSSGKRSPEKVKLLKDIGWTPKPDREYMWEKRFQEAKRIYEETGEFPMSKHPSGLWQWADSWVKINGEKKHEKMSRLLSIGFSRKRKGWEVRYRMAKEHFERTGHFPTRKENPKLRIWFSQWKHRCGQAFPERMAMLRDIGFESKTSC